MNGRRPVGQASSTGLERGSLAPEYPTRPLWRARALELLAAGAVVRAQVLGASSAGAFRTALEGELELLALELELLAGAAAAAIRAESELLRAAIVEPQGALLDSDQGALLDSFPAVAGMPPGTP